MSRKAKIITLSEFKSKVQHYENGEFSNRIDKDLSKIMFDTENLDFSTGFFDDPQICGYHILSNGMPVLFGNAGGDWEHPVVFILYWDGKQVRGYIPEKGNTFNPEFRCAYGSEQDTEKYNSMYPDTYVYEPETLPNPSFKLMEEDIITRIQLI